MTPTYFSLNFMFLLSLAGLALHQTHLVSALLCIEGMMLALFCTFTVLFSTLNNYALTPAPIILLTLSACEAATGLALLVATSRTHGNDYLQNFNLLQC